MRLKSPKLIKQLFGVLAFLLLAHILLSILIVFSPAMREYFKKNTITHYYRDYAVIGPFFTAHSVRSSHDISISFRGDEWSNLDYPIRENHQIYLKIGSFSSLKRARFENFLAGSFYTNEQTKKPGIQADKSVHRNYALKYFEKKYYPLGKLDSIQVIILSNFLIDAKLQSDTVVALKYLVQ